MKKVYLLGAGFTNLYGGPTTASLTNTLASLNSVNRSIVQELQNYFGGNDYTFETILASLEAVVLYTQPHYKHNINDTIIPALFNLKETYNRCDVEKSYIDSINYIIDSILSYEGKSSSTNNDVILSHFFQQDCQNHIYSLNYDRIIPAILGERKVQYSDGTSNNSAFRSYIANFVNGKNTFFNLHGNISLHQCQLSFNSVFQSTSPNYLKCLTPIIGGNPAERVPFTPIIAGYSKTQRVLSQPFSFGFSCFIEDLQSCEELEIIGYSFSDSYINGLLQSFFDFHNKKLTIVDYYSADDYEDRIESFQSNLSFFYHTIPENYSRNNGMINYKGYKLYIYTEGISEYLKFINEMNLIDE